MKISVIGTVGLPAKYGGFETLLSNLADFHHKKKLPTKLLVYCSSIGLSKKPDRYLSAELKYIPLKANGFQSIFYDIISALNAVRSGADVLVVLGVSGAVVLPIIRLCSRVKVIVNIDGVEWRREKWNLPAKTFLKFSESIAIRSAHAVIADNLAISKYVNYQYKVSPEIIAYGGDHVHAVPRKTVVNINLPSKYAFSLCRIEPENNVELILRAFQSVPEENIVFVGNWKNSKYGLELYSKYSGNANVFLLDPIYDLGVLRGFREDAWLYIHGHSAGGTNPVLVEAMHFNLPILAYDCSYNRATTDNLGCYFKSEGCIVRYLKNPEDILNSYDSNLVRSIATNLYSWDRIGEQYFELASKVCANEV